MHISQNRPTFKQWIHQGEHWIWLNASAVSISLIMVFGLLAFIMVKGLGHFWPASVYEFDTMVNAQKQTHAGELVKQQSDEQDNKQLNQSLYKIGNREHFGLDFKWFNDAHIENRRQPSGYIVLEREEWGNVYARLIGFTWQGKTYEAVDNLQQALDQSHEQREAIHAIERYDMGKINHALRALALDIKKLKSEQRWDATKEQSFTQKAQALESQYQRLNTQLNEQRAAFNRLGSLQLQSADGHVFEVALDQIIRAYYPNQMSVFEKMQFYFAKMWEFVSDDPREANTEGGIFPAIFGTVVMVLLMTILVTPIGVIAAIYLREYAKQGLIVRMIRISVNNLAGIPSIVYGVFGLGFFVYFIGGSIDELFYDYALPSPTFGSPGLLWASLTLALLTLPVVIVSTEEGLARIPSSIREGSLALGATKFETLTRTVLPMASPAIMTGLILAIARAAGEVAPLMLVGVVKLAPDLAIDSIPPFLHLDRQFMHLGFHIFDVGFQSPNVEAARPLVYATALLLIIIVIVLNLFSIKIRNHLREKYKALE